MDMVDGNVRFLIGGTALYDTDYTIAGARRVTQNPIIVELPATGTDLVIPISPKDTPEIYPDRSPTQSKEFVLKSSPEHTLHMT